MMKKPFIVFLFLIAFLTPAYGYPWMAGNNSTAQVNITQSGQAQFLLNTTSSDKDIILWHLIEVDAHQIQSQKILYVRETLIFENKGTQNFSGSLRTWLPAGAQIIKRNESGEITKEEMTTGNIAGYLPIEQNTVQSGNIVSWQDGIETSSIAFYIIEYMVANPQGTLNENVVYTKKLAYPALINYQYGAPGLDIPPLTLVITKPQDSSVILTDENGNKINPSDENVQGSTVTERFGSVQFQELNIGFSGAIDLTHIAVYVIIGLLIVIALSYSFLRKRSARLQSFEEKIRGSLQKEEVQETEKEISETVEKIEREPRNADEEDPELEGKTKDELLDFKNEMLSKQGELDKEYKSGNLLDEEYDELRKPLQEKIEKINKRIKEL